MDTEIRKLLEGHLSAEKIPEFSLVDTSKNALQHWVANLPMLNVGNTAKQIFTTLQELAVLDVSDALRYELMEILLPAIESIIVSMSKHYRDKGYLGDQRVERIVQISLYMRAYSAMIYHGIALRTFKSSQEQRLGFLDFFKKKDMINLMAKASHRGLGRFYALLLKIRILHLDDYVGMWLRIHELYTLVNQMGLVGYSFEDAQLHYSQKLSIEQMYLRLIFLSSCHTLKLRTAEIKKVGLLGELWLDLIQISTIPNDHALIYVDCHSDSAPMYVKELHAHTTDCFYINVDPLIQHIEHLHDADAGLLHPDEGKLFSTVIKHHLLHVLQSPKERASERQPQEGTLNLALGFIGSHYQLAGQRPFTELMQTVSDFSVFDMADSYSTLNLNYEMVMEEGSLGAMDEYFATHEGQMVNASDNGFCIRWTGIPPRTLRPGELISLQSNREPGWQVGVIRWVRSNLGINPEFGVEILSEQSIACGGRILNKNGNASDYLRTLLLPPSNNQCVSTLITPSQVFKSGVSVFIRFGEGELQVRLGRVSLATQGFSQFEFVVEENKSTLLS